jgi:rhodanese-related sulfurtransferase
MQAVKQKFFILVIGIALIALSSLAISQTTQTTAKITAEEARKMMSKLKEKDYIILDVRTEQEFKEKRIEKAVLIPDYELSQRAKTELTDKNKVILVYCRSGRRSAKAAAELVSMGYANVYDFGGIQDWGYETVSGSPGS